MINKVIHFLHERHNTRKAAFVGSIAALCALFMGISQPDTSQARDALAVVQVFWLVLLTVSLTSLFIDFVKFTWQHESSLNKLYDLPFNFVITATVTVILGGVVVNLWNYIVLLYSKVFAVFTVVWGFPSAIVIGCIFAAVYIKKREKKIILLLQIFADSVTVGLLVMVAGLYLEFSITKLFQTHWFYPIAPLSAVGFFILIVIITLCRGRNLLKPFQD